MSATTTSDKPKKRRRLLPEERKNEILDTAAKTVLEQGISAVSMEQLARDSGVSKGLVYNYFANRNEVFVELLQRAYADLRRRGQRELMRAKNFEDQIRYTTRAYLTHVQANGALIQRLSEETAAMSILAEDERQARRETRDRLAARVHANFELSQEDATMATDILMGLTDAAAKYMVAENADPLEVEEATLIMLLGAISGLEADRAK